MLSCVSCWFVVYFPAQFGCAVKSERSHTDPCVKRYETEQQGGSGRVDSDEVRVAGREPVDENRAEEVDGLRLCLCSRRQELRAKLAAMATTQCEHLMIEFVAESAAKYELQATSVYIHKWDCVRCWLVAFQTLFSFIQTFSLHLYMFSGEI